MALSEVLSRQLRVLQLGVSEGTGASSSVRLAAIVEAHLGLLVVIAAAVGSQCHLLTDMILQFVLKCLYLFMIAFVISLDLLVRVRH